jgi:serine/threonine-protein kinase
MKTLREENYSSADVASRISKDAVLTAEVVRSATSVFDNTGDGVEIDLARAVFMIGTQGLRRAIANVVLRPITFPVAGPVTYVNDFGACRDGCARAHKGNDIIQRLGYTDRPTDTASGLQYHSTYLRYLEQNSASNTNWNVLIMAQPSPIYFWYRQSPRYLEVAGWRNGGWVSEDDPPHDVSGMVSAKLDSQGRLISFTAVPPQVDESSEKPPSNDWAPLLAAAGFDPAKLTPTEAKWTPPTAFDARAAWTGIFTDQPQFPLRIEAAAYRGKPVYFQIVAPWTRPTRMQAIQPTTRMRVQYTIDLLAVFIILLVAVLLARHNVRKGRGDRRGAFRLALFIFAVSILAWIFGANHAPTRNEIFRFFVIAVSSALLLAGLFWLVYLALEPYVRRRWPNTSRPRSI